MCVVSIGKRLSRQNEYKTAATALETSVDCQRLTKRDFYKMIGNKFFYLSVFALICVAAAAGDGPVVGGHRELSGEELEKAIENLHKTLSKLATGDGPSFKAVKVTKVTTQLVAGTLETYNVVLSKDNVDKECTVKIWSQPWLTQNGTNVKINCEGDDTKVDQTW